MEDPLRAKHGACKKRSRGQNSGGDNIVGMETEKVGRESRKSTDAKGRGHVWKAVTSVKYLGEDSRALGFSSSAEPGIPGTEIRSQWPGRDWIREAE